MKYRNIMKVVREDLTVIFVMVGKNVNIIFLILKNLYVKIIIVNEKSFVHFYMIRMNKNKF